jgi:hypothetical protein
MSKDYSTSTEPGRWRCEVIADDSGIWCANAITYDTKEEAVAAGSELSGRWFAVSKWRGVEVTTPKRQAYEPGSEDGGW